MKNESSVLKNKEAIKRGKCFYGDAAEYDVKIVKWHIFYGTGDYEDLIDIREDRQIECYYVFYEDLVNKGNYNVGGGCFLTIEEAIASIEKKTNIKWY